MSAWLASVITVQPEMFPGPLAASLSGKALADAKWAIEAVDMRTFSPTRYGSVDDTPAGGGPGMVMRADIVAAAIDSVQRNGRPLILLSPRGTPLAQARARELAQGPGVVLVCGRYEGIDERVIEARAMEEISLGDFVLSGGELAAMALIDACVRLLPGVVGDEQSLDEESFETGLLEYPHYTRPPLWEGREIPNILMSGHHERIRAWRLERSREITKARRPDMWDAYLRRQPKTRH
jgi:tRNA (guanine37-N1)-methyltransferase